MVEVFEKEFEIKSFQDIDIQLKKEWSSILEKLLLLSYKGVIDKRIYDVTLAYSCRYNTFSGLFPDAKLRRDLASKNIKDWAENIAENMQGVIERSEKVEEYKKTAWKKVEEYIHSFLPSLNPLIDKSKYAQVIEIADTNDLNYIYVEFFKIFCCKMEIIKYMTDLLIEKNDEFLKQKNLEISNICAEKDAEIERLKNEILILRGMIGQKEDYQVIKKEDVKTPKKEMNEDINELYNLIK